jgi:hypothetical protein
MSKEEVGLFEDQSGLRSGGLPVKQLDSRVANQDRLASVSVSYNPTASEWARFKAALGRDFPADKISKFKIADQELLSLERRSDQGDAGASRYLAGLFGRRIVVVDPGGASFANGYVTSAVPELIFLNSKAKRPLFTVAGHELWQHLSIERPKLAAEVKLSTRMWS